MAAERMRVFPNKLFVNEFNPNRTAWQPQTNFTPDPGQRTSAPKRTEMRLANNIRNLY